MPQPNQYADASGVGPAMLAAVRFVVRNPGCTKLAAARRLGVVSHGYRVLDRCVRRGLLSLTPSDGCYALQITDRGKELVK